ncbi:helix-turn-helix domain-containing protein [Rhodocista pekingensis]|uniref:Helix-turn-helix domain-containing protein n=1 Tax=Rhodocista pekingensis TaxID=201185 RepID=A0ABW2KSH0_9PROT
MDAAAEQIRRLEPIAPQEDERSEVRRLSALLDDALKGVAAGTGRCRLVGPLGETVDLPPSVFYVLERVAEVMAHGDAITIVPVGQNLTTQQAANILNISRQHLVTLLEDGRIPYRKVGSHRRLDIQDVLAFRQERARQRRQALDSLAALSEEGEGYPELD